MKVKYLLLMLLQIVFIIIYYEVYMLDKFGLNNYNFITECAPLIRIVAFLNLIIVNAIIMNRISIFFNNKKIQKILNYKLFGFKKLEV